jgi:integrase
MGRGTWSYRTGERGVNRVRCFEHPVSGLLYLEIREGGRKVRKCLGHAERERGKRQADEAAARLRRPDARDGDTLSLATLFEMYGVEVTPHKGPSKQRHDRHAAAVLAEIIGPARPVVSLTHRDLARYAAERRRRGGPGGRVIGERVVEYDLCFLRAVCRWGLFGGLVSRDPTGGYRIKGNPSPRRPILASATYEGLLAVAGDVAPVFRTALVLARETGHRIGAIAKLRWEDVNLERREVRWRAENDKVRHEHTTPLPDTAVSELRAWRRSALLISEWVLPAPADGTRPVNVGVLRRYWRRAEERAAVPREAGCGFHALRRAFASDLRHLPLVDLAALGGWKRPEVIVRCYQKPDETEMRAALEARPRAAVPG